MCADIIHAAECSIVADTVRSAEHFLRGNRIPFSAIFDDSLSPAFFRPQWLASDAYVFVNETDSADHESPSLARITLPEGEESSLITALQWQSIQSFVDALSSSSSSKDSSISFVSASPHGGFVLFSFDSIKVFRHSSISRFVLFSCENEQIHIVGEGMGSNVYNHSVDGPSMMHADSPPRLRYVLWSPDSDFIYFSLPLVASPSPPGSPVSSTSPLVSSSALYVQRIGGDNGMHPALRVDEGGLGVLSGVATWVRQIEPECVCSSLTNSVMASIEGL